MTADDKEHERLVAEFMNDRQSVDPEHVALLCAKYPVLSGRQLRRVLAREIPLTFRRPEDNFNQGEVGDTTTRHDLYDGADDPQVWTV